MKMTTARKRKPAATKPVVKKAAAKMDAIGMLTADHKKVQKAFKDFEKLKKGGNKRGKSDIVRQTCADLTVHTTIEEEIFYPAARQAIKDMDVMDEAAVEHAGAKELIAQLESMQPGDDLYDAKFTVLGESVNHHIREEQNEMFPKVRKTKLDLNALGEQMAQRRTELELQISAGDGDDREKRGMGSARNRASTPPQY
jgi:hemerythrin superfamily protein